MSKYIGIVKSYAIMFLGCLIFSLGLTLFLIPAEINGGGISGIGALVYFATGIPAGLVYMAVNAVLIVIAIIHMGANFGAKTIVNMLFISAAMTLLQKYVTEPIIDDKFLSAVLGGIASGVGLGIVFGQGGTTGGTDIIAMLITKHRRISPGRIIMYCDVIIVSASWFVFKSAEILVYGYVSMWVVSYTLDAFLNGANKSTQIFIFSKQWQEIRDQILHTNGRGVTILNGEGGFTGDEVKIVMTVVRRKESVSIFKTIKEIDPNAFISMGSVMGVYGEGFDQIKV